MERNSEANENQTAPPDDVLENAELPAEEVAPPAETVEPPAQAVEPPADPIEPPALAEEPTAQPEEPEFAATSETKLETASEETGSKTDSEKQKTSKGSETDVQSKEIPEVSDEKALKKARRKAQRKGFFSKFDEHNDIEEEEMSECEYETDYADSFLDSKLITTNSELEDKLGSDFELSYKPLDDQEIETLLKSDREDGSDELDYKLESKQDTKDTVQMKDTFLKHFEIPSLSDISEEQEIEVKALRSSKRKVASNSNTITPAEVGNVNESTHSSISEESSKGSDGLDNLPLSNLGSLINVTAPRKAEFADEDAFIMFKDSILAGEFDDDRESIKHQLQLLTITMDFIQELLHKVVTESEKKEKQDSLTYKLNMVTMYDTLKEDVQSLRLEKETCNFLNSRMVDYYKRLKNFRLIKALPENLILPEYQRYMEALKWLDHVLNVAKETKRKVSFLMSSVLMDLTYVQNIMMDTEEHLQNIVLKLIGKRSEYLYKVAERELKLIEKKRNEISDERMFLLTRKHTLAQITHVSLKIYFTFSLPLNIYPSLSSENG